MSSLNLHFLDARGTLKDLRNWLAASLTEIHDGAIALVPIGPLDVIVQTGKRVIPEKGHLGYAPGPGVIFITVDPDNPALSANSEKSFERMFAHELHHAARWDGPGYGSSLGEALVSEGLAGHFVQEVCAGSPEPWEQLDIVEIRRHVTFAARDWDRKDYSHSGWFLGVGELPRWLGYSLGFQLVSRFMEERVDRKASNLAKAEARAFFDSLTKI